SKAELTGSDAVRDRLERELGVEVHAISAVTGQGLAQLVRRVAELLQSEKAADQLVTSVEPSP
ncbi:MAG: GTPase ObgE, partial [Gemmataceae bacterium]|nr:GTPase ObgE [Gemmataceae bacterium]